VQQFILVKILLRQETNRQNESCTSVRYSTGVATLTYWENQMKYQAGFTMVGFTVVELSMMAVILFSLTKLFA